MSIKTNLTLLAVVLASGAAYADEASELIDDYSYSYFTMGYESITYEEKFSPIESSVDASGIVINSGSLTHINDSFDFSIDANGTFSPSDAEETWSYGSTPLQKNNFEYMRATTEVLLHYKLTPAFRIVAGPSFSYQTYKRYNFEALASNVTITDGVIEERSTDIFLDAGLVYESAPVSSSRWKYSAKAIVGYSVWSEATNTQYDGLTFAPSGYRAALTSTVSYQVYPGVHLGVYASYRYDVREEDGGKSYTNSSGVTSSVTLPEATTTNLMFGGQASWSF